MWGYLERSKVLSYLLSNIGIKVFIIMIIIINFIGNNITRGHQNVTSFIKPIKKKLFSAFSI